MNDLKLPEIKLSIADSLSRMRDIIGEGPALILTHNNPDPDALASGAGLAVIYKAWGVQTSLVYSGLVARAENKAMLELLTPEWEPVIGSIDYDRFSAIVLVDTQPMAGNNNLPHHVIPHVVIDHHHPVRKGLEHVPFVDVRPEIGSTVTMVYQYMEMSGLEFSSDLITAVFYGIQTDTRGLSRGVSPIDQTVYLKLLTLIDREKLVQVEQAGLSRDYFRAFNRGLHSAQIYDHVVISYLGQMHRPDFVAEMADILIRLENSSAVLCIGYHEATLYLSLRTKRVDNDAGILIQKVVSKPGDAGGHGTTAGGQVPLSNPSNEDEIQQAVEEIRRRFLDLMGEETAGESLL